MLHRMAADADADREVVEEDQLVARESSRIVRYPPRRSEREAVPNRADRDPRGAPAIRLPASERAGPRQLQRIGSLQLRSLHYIVDRCETIPPSSGLQSVERFLAQTADVPPPDAKRRLLRIRGRRRSAFPVAITH